MCVKEAKVVTKKTIILNSKVRTFASILRVLAIIPMYAHFLVNKESIEPFFGWYNKYTFVAFFELHITLLLVIISIPLQAYLVSTIPILFITFYAIFEFFIEIRTPLLVWSDLLASTVLTILVVKSWQALSQSKILESKVSRQILERLTERDEVKINLHEKPENSIIS